jgi:hypothetical protein
MNATVIIVLIKNLNWRIKMKHMTLKVTLTAIIALFLIYMVMGSMRDQAKDEATPEVTVTEGHSFDDLLDEIEWKESKGIATAVGDNGFAVGAYQLHNIYVHDYYRITKESRLGLPTTAELRLSKRWSRRITKTVTQHYAHAAYPELAVTDIKFMEAAARVHNGGGDGWRNDPGWFVRNRGYTLEQAKKKIANTQAYWADVKARMERK